MTLRDTLEKCLFMPEEIKPNAIYTTAEAQSLLRVSNSTMKRLLKRGLLKANKVGRQYRILGKEILSLISPELENESAQIYLRAKKKVVDVINRWPN